MAGLAVFGIGGGVLAAFFLLFQVIERRGVRNRVARAVQLVFIGRWS